MPKKIMLFVSIPSPELAVLAVESGVEGVILDCEHGFPIGSEIRAMVLACQASGGECIVRIPPSALHLAGILADLGVDGVLLSGVRSMEEIERLLRVVSFPRMGDRSINPFVPAAGCPGDIARLRESARSMAIWAMAETGEFLRQLESSAATGALDGEQSWKGIIVGPYDLAEDLDCTNDPTDGELRDNVFRYAELAEQRRLDWGMFVRDVDTLRRWEMVGISPALVIIGYDRDIWYQECRNRVRALVTDAATTSSKAVPEHRGPEGRDL